jgi:hypothetical protein
MMVARGSPKITQKLRDRGRKADKNLVAKRMPKAGLHSKVRRKGVGPKKLDNVLSSESIRK